MQLSVPISPAPAANSPAICSTVSISATSRWKRPSSATTTTRKPKTVRLLKSHFDGRSLAAVAVATHEVSHALQDARGERLLALRQTLAKFAAGTDRIAAFFFVAAPVLGLLARTPLAFAALVGVGVSLLAVRVVVSLVTLPVEIDASFSKALPILKDGNYVAEQDMPAVRSLLRAAAFTYLAGALISLVNLARWIRLLR